MGYYNKDPYECPDLECANCGVLGTEHAKFGCKDYAPSLDTREPDPNDYYDDPNDYYDDGDFAYD